MTKESCLIKFISKNKEEDFAIYNYAKGEIITYLNMPNAFDQITMVENEKYQITNKEIMRQEGLHTAVISPDDKFLILVDKNNIYSYDIKEKKITNTVEE